MDIFKALCSKGGITLHVLLALLPIDLRKNNSGGNQVLKLGPDLP